MISQESWMVTNLRQVFLRNRRGGRLSLPQYLSDFPIVAFVDGLDAVDTACLRRALRRVTDFVRAPQLRNASVGIRGELYLPLVEGGRTAFFHPFNPVFDCKHRRVQNSVLVQHQGRE